MWADGTQHLNRANTRDERRRPIKDGEREYGWDVFGQLTQARKAETAGGCPDCRGDSARQWSLCAGVSRCERAGEFDVNPLRGLRQLVQSSYAYPSRMRSPSGLSANCPCMRTLPPAFVEQHSASQRARDSRRGELHRVRCLCNRLRGGHCDAPVAMSIGKRIARMAARRAAESLAWPVHRRHVRATPRGCACHWPWMPFT